MNGKISVILGILGGIIFVGGIAFINSQPDELKSTDETSMEDKTNTDSDEAESEVVVNEDSEDSVIVEDEMPGEYTDYDPSLLSRADTGDVVLFFHASWCPTCVALESNINSNSSDIPSGLTILQLDFDSEKDLKNKYNVVVQHTLVQVDSSGEQIAKWIGGNTLSYLVGKVQ